MRFASFSKFRSSYSIHGLIIPSPFLLNPPFTRPQSSNSKGPTSAPAAPIVFDRPLKTLQKDNAARLSLLQPEAEEDEAEGGGVLRYQYLRDEIGETSLDEINASTLQVFVIPRGSRLTAAHDPPTRILIAQHLG